MWLEREEEEEVLSIETQARHCLLAVCKKALTVFKTAIEVCEYVVRLCLGLA